MIIDDDVPIGDMLEEALHKNGYGVSRAYSGTEALLAVEAHRPDLVLLDLMLPGLPGEEVLLRIHGIPVIVLSAKGDVSGKVRLLLDGAADYVTKPFDVRELLARVAARLRDAPPPSKSAFSFSDLYLDDGAHSVRVGQEPVRLTRTEYAILKLLIQNPSQVVTKSQILDHIAADTPDCTESSLKMHVSNLRKKLREAGGTESVSYTHLHDFSRS